MLALCALFAGLSLHAAAAEPLVIDDFERGGNGWYEVDGRPDRSAPPTCEMQTVAEARQGIASARLRFRPCPDSWAHMQLTVRPVDWIGAGCDRLALWVRGDGSGEALNVMLGNYDARPTVCSWYPITLDFTGWQHYVLPFAEFVPEPIATRLSQVALIQLNVRNTSRPVEVLVDDIVALPAQRPGEGGNLSALEVATAPGWDQPAPPAPVQVDPLLGIPAGVELPRMVHGIRNHLDLHNPVQFAAEYAEPGEFAVRVGRTSGYGGSALIIRLDGQETLRREFPGQTNADMFDYQGYYAIPVPEGRHTLEVDNDGADWIQVDSYRFGNYGRGRVSVSRDDGAIIIRVVGADARPLPGLEAGVRVAGRAVPVALAPDGTLRTAGLLEAFPTGTYPATATVRQGGKVIYTGTARLATGTPRVVPEHVTFDAGQPIALALSYCNAAGVALPGQALALRVGPVGVEPGASLAMREGAEGRYLAELGALSPGVYEATISAPDGDHRLRLLMTGADNAIARTGVVRLGDNGRFVTGDGGDFVPWGFATIQHFRPVAETAWAVGQWAFMSDDVVRDWVGLLRTYGVNVIRFGVNVDSMKADQGGRLDPDIAARLRHLLDLIEPLGVRALPVMWWGHYGNFSFGGISAYDELIKTQADWFTSPQALELQRQYVREVVAPYAGDPRIFAWEVMNETYAAGGDRPAAIRWTNEIARTIRESDPTHLITTSAAEATPAAQIEWIRGAEVDFFNWHAYPTYTDYGVFRQEAGQGATREIGNYALLMALADAGHGRPVILGETGNDRMAELDYPEFRTLITRDCLWLAFLAGSPGGISWDAIADPREFDILSRIAGQFDWRLWQTAPPVASVTVTDYARDLGTLAAYAWWSLETGTSLDFARPSPGVAAVPSDRFAPPAPQPRITCSPGYQVRCLASADEQALIAYVRNLSGVLPQNVRTRTAAPLSLGLGAEPGTWEVWDLDDRRVLRAVATPLPGNLDLGTTNHDFALVFRAAASD